MGRHRCSRSSRARRTPRRRPPAPGCRRRRSADHGGRVGAHRLVHLRHGRLAPSPARGSPARAVRRARWSGPPAGAQRSRSAAPLRAERGGIAARSSSPASTTPSSSGAVRLSAYSSSSQVTSWSAAAAASTLVRPSSSSSVRSARSAVWSSTRATKRPRRPPAAARWRGTRRPSRPRCRAPRCSPASRLSRPSAGRDGVDRVAARRREGDRPRGCVERLATGATATASIRSSGPSWARSPREALGQLLDGVAHALLAACAAACAARTRRRRRTRASPP